MIVARPFAYALAVLAAAFFCIGSTAVSHAAGYWKCSSGAWVAIARPQHAAPLKTCGSHLDIPHTQDACEKAGGKWGRAGLFPRPTCKIATRDGGRICGDADECEGLCLAPLTPGQRDLLRKHVKLSILGKCTATMPVFGCMAIVNEGFVSGLLCKD